MTIVLDEAVDDRVVATYERANRIFSGMPITCTAAEPSYEMAIFGIDPPAWSVDSDIFFSQQAVTAAATSKAHEKSLAGLNFHELGHVLYTPGRESWIRQAISVYGLADAWPDAFNILEDHRIETLLAAQFPTMATNFVEAFHDFVVKDPRAVYTAHLLAHGRRFLPTAVRTVLRDEFVGTPDERDQVDAIIDEYRQLVLGPRQTPECVRAVDLVRSFAAIMRALQEPIPRRPHGSNYGGAVSTFRQLDAQEARELIENGAVNLSIQRRHGKGISRRSSTSRSGQPYFSPLSPPEPSDSIESIAVPASYVSVSRRFRHELERIRVDADAGWAMRESSGRLNVQRAMVSSDPAVAFDRWDNAVHDASDIEAVLLIDNSGSMDDSITDACCAAWAIKRAIEVTGGRVTVLSYSDYAELVYSATDHAHPVTLRRVPARWGTNPVEALEHARATLTASDATNRMLITLTDGHWEGADKSADLVQSMSEAGIATALCLLGGDAPDDAHGHAQVDRIAAPVALVKVARGLVRSTTRRRVA